MEKTNPNDAHVQILHKELGIPESYPRTCGLDFYVDCETLVESENDVFGRQAFMAPDAFAAWQNMQAAAGRDNIELQIVSAFRSVDYQAELLRKKLGRGDSIEAILKVNAAPGFSEHHSGCALDITTPGFEPLEEEFESSPAFTWLCQHAGNFGFSLSFPRENTAGIAYEPWHWKYDLRKKHEKKHEK